MREPVEKEPRLSTFRFFRRRKAKSQSRMGEQPGGEEETIIFENNGIEEDMASVSIRVRNDEGDDFVVSPSDVVENINEISSRRNSRRDSTPSSSIRRSRPSSAFFNENGEPLDVPLGGIPKARKTKSMKEVEPGLRSMLYGLTQKQEKEEAEAKKLAKKMICKSEFFFWKKK